MEEDITSSVVEGIRITTDNIEGLSLWTKAYLKLAPRKISKFVLSEIDCFVSKTDGKIVTMALYIAPDTDNQRLYIDYSELSENFVAELMIQSDETEECQITKATILDFAKVHEVVENWKHLYE